MSISTWTDALHATHSRLLLSISLVDMWAGPFSSLASSVCVRLNLSVTIAVSCLRHAVCHGDGAMQFIWSLPILCSFMSKANLSPAPVIVISCCQGFEGLTSIVFGYATALYEALAVSSTKLRYLEYMHTSLYLSGWGSGYGDHIGAPLAADAVGM